MESFDNFYQFWNQTRESYLEQKMALTLSIQIIDKYRSTTGAQWMTYIKNLIIYGLLGTGN